MLDEDTNVFSRRLPVYVLVDCSGSMAGEPIAAMEMGLKALVGELREDPQALETVWLSIITFESTAEQVVPLSDIRDFETPSLVASGTTALGEAATILKECIDEEVRTHNATQKGDWKPLAFIFTDGEPTDDWEKTVQALRNENKITIVACGAGPEVNEATLRRIGHKNLRLDNTQPETLKSFMEWVTISVTMTSQSVGTRAKSGELFADVPEQGGVIRLLP